MKKRYVLFLLTAMLGFIMIAQSQKELEAARQVSLDLNEQILEMYEVRVSKDVFKDDLEKYLFVNSYTGFLGWTSVEYLTFDDEFEERVKGE